MAADPWVVSTQLADALCLSLPFVHKSAHCLDTPIARVVHGPDVQHTRNARGAPRVGGPQTQHRSAGRALPEQRTPTFAASSRSLSPSRCIRVHLQSEQSGC